MLTQLDTVRQRLGLDDTVDDDLLTRFINQVGTMFDSFCNRQFERGEGIYQEFRADELDITLSRYPIEVIVGFELKRDEGTDWEDISDPLHVVRNGCVVSLQSALGTQFQHARVQYTGGYVVPGTTAEEWQTALPALIEQACIDQVTHWYRTRNLSGVASTSGEKGAIAFDRAILLPHVQAILETYRRIQL